MMDELEHLEGYSLNCREFFVFGSAEHPVWQLTTIQREVTNPQRNFQSVPTACRHP